MQSAQHINAYVQGLRDLADFMEAHPECVPAYNSTTVNLFPPDINAVLRAGYGRLEKRGKGKWFTLVKQFGPAASVEWNVAREAICEMVKVGTKTVPAQAAVPEHEEDVFDWVCPPALLKTVQEGLQTPDVLVE